MNCLGKIGHQFKDTEGTMKDERSLEIANEMNKLMDELRQTMPEGQDISLAWQFVSYSLQCLWHRIYNHETHEIWFNTPKEIGIEL